MLIALQDLDYVLNDTIIMKVMYRHCKGLSYSNFASKFYLVTGHAYASLSFKSQFTGFRLILK